MLLLLFSLPPTLPRHCAPSQSQQGGLPHLRRPSSLSSVVGWLDCRGLCLSFSTGAHQAAGTSSLIDVCDDFIGLPHGNI